MTKQFTRRMFGLSSGMAVVGGTLAGSWAVAQQDPPVKPEPPAGPVEASFERDYDPPKFKPGWKNPQLNRTMVQDFVIYAHDNLDMVKKLLEREPKLLNGDHGLGER